MSAFFNKKATTTAKQFSNSAYKQARLLRTADLSRVFMLIL